MLSKFFEIFSNWLEIPVQFHLNRMDESIRQFTKSKLQTFQINQDELPPIKVIHYSKSQDEILKRAIALFIIATDADGLLQHPEDVEGCRKFSNKITLRYSASEYFSPEEKAFLSNKSPEQNQIGYFCWRWECINVLTWILGLNDSIDLPLHQSETFKVSRPFSKYRTFETISKISKLRSEKELNEFNDLAICCDSISQKQPNVFERGCIEGWKMIIDWISNSDFQWP